MNEQNIGSEMPMGFGMALAQNEQAMMQYAALSEAEKQQVIAGTHAIASKNQMHEYVRQLAQGKFPEVKA